MKPGGRSAFTLVELILAIVFVGLVLAPLFVFVARIHDLNSALGEQARREASRSFDDQALAAGIDPALAPALLAAANPAVPALPTPRVESSQVTPLPGFAAIVPIHLVVDASAAESRVAGAGFQIGPGAEIPARTTPHAPLAPIVMPAPTLTPANGTAIATTALSPAAAGQPYTTEIQASSGPDARVFVSLNQPAVLVHGNESVSRAVTAAELMNRVTGAAWSEYPGNPSTGDQAVALGDGRTRWLTTRSDGRVQIYEPSAVVPFAYRIELGTPVLVRGAAEIAAVGTLVFDYADFLSVQEGLTPLRIDFPTAVKAVFGNAWNTSSIGFQWTFHGAPGPFSGDLAPFFTADSLSGWSDSVEVAATPVVPSGAAAEPADWSLSRTRIALGAPVLSSTPDPFGFYSPGELQFHAPAGPDGVPLGRLSFDDGATLSTGPGISVDVYP